MSQNSKFLSEEAKRLIYLAQVASLVGLTSFSGVSNIEMSQTLNSMATLGHWVSLILISGAELKIIFKVHYTTNQARFFSKNVYKENCDDTSPLEAIDFMKEYCNLTGGILRKVFDNQSINTGISIPVAGRSFDEIFNTSPNDVTSFQNSWKLGCLDAYLVCSVWIEVTNSKTIKDLDMDSAEALIRGEGLQEIEFL